MLKVNKQQLNDLIWKHLGLMKYGNLVLTKHGNEIKIDMQNRDRIVICELEN